MRIRVAAFAALFMGASLGAQIPVNSAAPPGTGLTEAEVLALAKSVKSIRVEPTAVRLRVGQKANIANLVVTVLDSADKVRGKLAGFDFAMAPGQAASAVPGTITADRPGTATFIVRYPRRAWEQVRTGTRPEAKVTITVTP
jgi:hypothetical protein